MPEVDEVDLKVPIRPEDITLKTAKSQDVGEEFDGSVANALREVAANARSNMRNGGQRRG